MFLSCGLAAQDGIPVILISIDTLRADRVSAYGYHKLRTPEIDSFAGGGTLFSAIDSQIPLTLPSHTSLFTSTYPFANGIEENGERVPAGAVTLATVLRAHGYRTAAFVGSILLHRRLGLDQGFDVYDSPFDPAGGSRNPYSMRVRRDGALVLRAARQYLETHRGQKVFVFVHLFDLHAPYARAAAAGPLPRAAGYDAELAYVDGLLGRFRQALVAGGWWDRSLVVLLSDHGESLGEHGETSHGYFAYQSTLWVPLIMHWPKAQPRHPARVDRPGGLIDVAPTILESLDIARPASFVGSSLLANAGPHPVASEAVYARDAFRWAPLRSLREGSFQFIDAPKPELYDLHDDRAERTNLAAAHPAEAAKLRSELSAIWASAKTAPQAPAHRSSLESLGYVSPAAPLPGNQPAPDPKDRLPQYNLFESALTTMYAGHPDAAVPRFRRLIAQDPQSTMARYYLGEAFVRLGQAEEAIREWNAALSRDPGYEPLYLALGEVWMARRDYARAESYFLQATTLAPFDADAFRGAALAETALKHEGPAGEHWRKACALAPEFSECRK
ncbi:MAG TPA: sulfatase-like hydrolase/transferase [Bryobacteraceae bacterium]|nr:sulfatase-like hydrolase/transferase [Bryobacteraceae bacterium]